MRQLVPYERYSLQDACRCFSDANDGKALCDGQWIEFPDAVVGMMRVARHEPEIHFCDAGRFHWYADKPYQVSTEHAEYSAIPQCVLDARETGTPLHLFVQCADSDDFVYIGEMSPPGMYGSGRDGKFAEATLICGNRCRAECGLRSADSICIPTGIANSTASCNS